MNMLGVCLLCLLQHPSVSASHALGIPPGRISHSQGPLGKHLSLLCVAICLQVSVYPSLAAAGDWIFLSL